LEVFVQPMFRNSLLAIIGFTLIGMPASASPKTPASAPLGVVLQADNAQVGQDVTAGGATIYDGDRLQTTDGTLRARLGGPQIFLHTNTVTQVHGLPNGFSAELGAGTVAISSTQGQSFQLLADGVTIRPAGTQGAVAQVTKVSPTELLLSSSRGGIEVTMGDESKMIEAGSSYRMEVQPEDSSSNPDPQGAPQVTGHSHRMLFYLIVGGVAAATGVLIWRALESPSGL
jgi:hypothetical protein